MRENVTALPTNRVSAARQPLRYGTQNTNVHSFNVAPERTAPRVLLIEPDKKLKLFISAVLKNRGYDVTEAETSDIAAYDLPGVTKPTATGKAAFDLVILGEEGAPTSPASIADKFKANNRFNIPLLLISDNIKMQQTMKIDDPRLSTAYAQCLAREGILRDDEGWPEPTFIDTLLDSMVALAALTRKAKAQFPPQLER